MTDAGEGFPKSCRLSKPSQYRSVFASNRRSADSHFLVIAAANGLELARLGIAVSRRNVRTATNRNRVKRLIREGFRRNRKKLAGLDIVVVSQRRAADADNKGLIRSLDKHWETIIK